MVARFPNMISTIHNSIKTGLKFCEVPVNKLCINTLRLLRERNLIYGFTFVSSKKKTKRLYPRAKIFLKFSDHRTSTIRYIRPVKNNFSNFFVATIKINKQNNSNKKFLLTTPQGLNLISFNDVNQGLITKPGKILLEIAY